MSKLTWMNIAKTGSCPETFFDKERGWWISKPVLVFDFGQMLVAQYEQIDEDCATHWRSCCSNGWELKGVTDWAAIAPPK